MGINWSSALQGREVITPAEYVIYVFNGVRATARAVGRSPSTVSKWQKPKDQKGHDGYVPSNVQRKILEVARERGLDITAKDLIFGRKLVRDAKI